MAKKPIRFLQGVPSWQEDLWAGHYPRQQLPQGTNELVASTQVAGGKTSFPFFEELWSYGVTRATTATFLSFAFFSKLAGPDVVNGM